MVSLVRERKRISLVITPEGTRTPGARWRRGFYEVANRTNIPVVLVAFDYVNRKVVIGARVYMTGVLVEDLGYIRNWYGKNTSGYDPVINENDFETS